MQEEKPPRRQPYLKSAPKIREFYWCDFPKDSLLPEFWKRRPVIVISKNNPLYGNVTIIPCTTKQQIDGRYAVPLSLSITKGEASRHHAICNYVTTISISRLIPDKTGIQRISEEEFKKCMEKLHSFLPF